MKSEPKNLSTNYQLEKIVEQQKSQIKQLEEELTKTQRKESYYQVQLEKHIPLRQEIDKIRE